jgi:hypothetical protein
MGRKSAEEWADYMAETVISKGMPAIRTDPRLSAVTDLDKRCVSRIVGGSVEVFNARLSEKLAVIADKIAQRMEEHLDADRYKPGELAFALATIEDKRSRLDGRTALASGSVNVQINNYGEQRSREEILASIEGIDLPPNAVSASNAVTARPDREPKPVVDTDVV